MKRTLSLIILITITILAFVSCERFEKPEVIDYDEVKIFFEDFINAADVTTGNSTDAFLSFFHPDYLNNGLTKQGIEGKINSIFLEDENRKIKVELAKNQELALINGRIEVDWSLKIVSADSVLIDSVKYGDYFRKYNSNYYFYGDQIENTDIAINSFFINFSTVADTISADNIEFFMDFFHADYLHNGQTKQDMEDYISGIFLVNEPRFIDVILLSNDDLHVEWKLVITTTDNLLIDEITYNDVMKEEGETYYLYGNQVEPVEEDKLMVFAEIMTATWCGTCPEVEAAMHDYLYANPETFFYLEYHVMDAIAGEHEFFDNFYGFTNPPVAIIQGDESFVGDQSSLYPSVLDGLKQRDAQFKLSNLLEISNDENYTATVNIEKLTDEEFDTSNLKLRWAFYEEASAVNNYSGQPCRHVVLTEGYYNVTADDLNNTFSINLDYPRDIPDDMGIVFWLQTANDTYDDDSFVHAWIKQDLGSK
ncbi:hypothetical protein JEZ13_07000 [bacterium]|nr:hypothetical protein [bacterium]